MNHKTKNPSDTPAAADVGELAERLNRLREAARRPKGPAGWKVHNQHFLDWLSEHMGPENVAYLRALISNDLTSALASSAAETARLREERDHFERRFLQWLEAANVLGQRVKAAEAEKEAMRVEAIKVLEPFAKAARASSVMEGRSGDCYKLAQNGGRIAFMDLRKAATLHTKLSASLSLKEEKK